MKCPRCNSKNVHEPFYLDSITWLCWDCNNLFIPRTPRHRSMKAALIISGICIVIFVLLILGALSLMPVTLTFWGQSCGWTGGDTTTCEPVAYHTTRPLWLWLWEGGW